MLGNTILYAYISINLKRMASHRRYNNAMSPSYVMIVLHMKQSQIQVLLMVVHTQLKSVRLMQLIIVMMIS
jgi:hypothetical protein